MTNKEIYKIADELGMIEHNGIKLCNGDEAEPIDKRTDAEIFEEDTATSLVDTMNFVDSLCSYNDLETVKKLLVAIIYTNK